MKHIYLYLFLTLLTFISCKNRFVNTEYANPSGTKYIKFIDGKNIEWKWNYKFRPEAFEYSIENGRIRTIRKVLDQVWYIEIIDKNTLEDHNGNTYHLIN